MFFLSFILVALSWYVVQGAVVPRSHVAHEKRDSPPLRWVKRDRISSNTILPMRIGLRQRNLEKVDDFLMEVSNPGSSRYGKHWTSDEVVQMFAPSEDTVSSIRDWLIANKITADRITHSENQGWLAFDAAAEEIEALLHTEYHQYEHKETGDVAIACDDYYIPKNLKHHVDYVTPGLRLMARSSISGRATGGSGSRPPPFVPVSNLDVTSADLKHCDSLMTPACIAALYNIPPGKLRNASNAMGIYESGDYYSQEDLDLFFQNYAPQIPKGTHPLPALIDGAQAPVPVEVAGIESSLDFQIAYPILWPQGTVLYQTDDINLALSKRGFFNDFLDAIDGSYCTFSAYGETGNDPNLDPQYPDPQKGGFKEKLECGVYKPTNVVSLSYGIQESDLPPYYQLRQCLEFAKLGLQGVSIVLASGDSGVQGRELPLCLGPNNNIFSPTFPVNCPYVTSVGATEIVPGNTVQDPEVAAEVAAWNFYSGGGFSNLYTTPNYQQDAVNFYFKNHNPPYPFYSTTGTIPLTGGVYNRIGRGIPDVSANGVNTTIYSAGDFGVSGGTSASAPTFAAIINRINEERIAVGKSPVGFLNPVLYQFPQMFNDITKGSNPGCGTNGFSTAPGWDPVTGLGTPNYSKMLDTFLSLP